MKQMLVAVMLVIFKATAGSGTQPTIVFTSSPSILHPPSTKTLTLRCAVWDHNPGNAGDGQSRCKNPYLCDEGRRLCFKCYLGDIEEFGQKRCKLKQYDSDGATFEKGYRLLVRPGDMTYSDMFDPEVGGRSCSASVAVERLCQGSLEFTMEFWGLGGKRLGVSDMSYTLTAGATGGDTADLDGDDILEVTSLSLLHGREEIALLEAGKTPRLLSNVSNMAVKGEVTTDRPERGYLQLTWTYPTVTETGEFTCAVTGIDTGEHNFASSKTLEVGQEDVSIGDLIHSLSVLQQDNLSLRKTCFGHVAENQRLRSQLQKLDASLTSLEEVMIELSHVESGFLDCGDSDSWHSRDMDYKYTNVTATFRQPYAAPPVVHISLFSRTSARGGGDAYYASLVMTSSQGFTVACGVPAGRCRVYSTMVTWVSLPV